MTNTLAGLTGLTSVSVTNTDPVKLIKAQTVFKSVIKVNVSLCAILTHEYVIGVFLHIAELLHSRLKKMIRDAFS